MHEPTNTPVKVSVIIVNYNAEYWMQRCFESLATQTIFPEMQVIVVDNASTDGSDQTAQRLMAGWPNSVFIQTGENLGFGRAVNHAVNSALGTYLLLLNADIWLESDCLEQLVDAAVLRQAAAVGVHVLNYEDNSFQNNGATGFDICGMGIEPNPATIPEELYMANGFMFIRRDVFQEIGGEDNAFFLYNEEGDLSARVWIAGHHITYAPKAHIHHRGAASANPKGGTKIVELRTSDSKRFYANRNHLLCLLKNSQHILLLLVLSSVFFLLIESLVGMVLSRRWSYFSRTYLGALTDCWRLRAHIRAERRRIRGFRKRSDFWMLRFFRFRFGRWNEYKRMLKLGMPIFEPR